MTRGELWWHEHPLEKIRPNTFLAEKIYFTKYITTLSSVRMTEVCRMLAYATSC
jgi:hypothetical protein